MPDQGKDYLILMLGIAGQAAETGAIPENVRVLEVRPVQAGEQGDVACPDGGDWDLPVKVSADLDEYCIANRSLPTGATPFNSPVQPAGTLPEALARLAPRVSLIVDPADWTSLFLLPHLVDFFLGHGCGTDVHLVCRSTLGTGILPAERYITGARLYGGLKEAVLMAARYSRSHPVRWCIWDVVPVLSALPDQMAACLKFILHRGRLDGCEDVPDRLQPHPGPAGGLYPPVCFAGTIFEIEDDSPLVRKEIRSNAVSRLQALLRSRGAAFQDADRSGWVKIEWLRRPTFYEAREDLEYYLGTHVWSGPGWNALLEGILNDAARAAYESIIPLFPAIGDVPVIKWGKKPEKDADACEAWLADSVEKAGQAADNVMEALDGLDARARAWLRSSPMFALGYGMSGKDTLLEYLPHKLEEIQVRTELSRVDRDGLSAAVQGVRQVSSLYRKLPEGILKKKLKERDVIMGEFSRKRREELDAAYREAAEALHEHVWLATLQAAKGLLEGLLTAIPTFMEAVAALPAGGGDDGDGIDSWLGDVALDVCAPSSNWDQYWDDLWHEVFDHQADDGAGPAIVRHIDRLVDISPEMLSKIRLAASAGARSGKPFQEIRHFWSAMKENIGVSGDGSDHWLHLVGEEETAEAKELAGRIARMSALGCRFFNAAPRCHAFIMGQLSDRERDQLFAESLMWSQVPGGSPSGARLTTVVLSEPFGFDRLQVFRETVADWLIWTEEKSRFRPGDDAGYPDWLPLSDGEEKQYHAAGRHVISHVGALLQCLKEGSLDWDGNGMITLPEENLEKDLGEWLSRHWGEKPAGAAARPLSEELLKAADDVRLEGIMVQAARFPLLDLFMGPIRREPRTGLIKLQEKFIPTGRNAGLWTFRQTT